MATPKSVSKKNRPPSKADMVLVAMNKASEATTAKIPYEEIVISAWKAFPEAFSLRSHPEHPDASDVHKCLYTDLVSKGLAVSLGSKVFRMTEEGIARAARFAGRREPSGNLARRLSRSEEFILRHVRASRPYATWVAGKKSELVDYDARLFFQFSSTTDRQERRRRASSVMATIEKAEQAGNAEAHSLLALAHYLRDTFVDLFDKTD